VRSISIIIPTWNGLKFIGQCLSSIDSQLSSGDEIIVVDNGSTDGTPAVVKRDFPRVQLLQLERNWGFAGGINHGLRRAQGAVLILVNQDVVLLPDCLRLIQARLQNTGSALLGGKLFYPDRQTIQHAGGIIQMPRGDSNHFGYRQIDRGVWNTPAEVDYVTGALFAFDRVLVNAVGLFDEGFYPAYYEEVDYCYRARAAGFPVICDPAIVALHYEAQATNPNSTEYYQAVHRGRLRFLLKHQSTAQFCAEFLPAEKRWLLDETSAGYRRILVHAYLHSMLTVPNLQAHHLLADPQTASVERLLKVLAQLSHYALSPHQGQSHGSECNGEEL
jgi:GT2 family glycosyltransferase